MESIHRNDLPVPGTPMEGGFFVGLINIDGAQFGVVVSPKDGGESSGVWGEFDQETEATSICDGLANTKAMQGAGSELAAEILSLNLNGFTDWYIPARDELEIIYRYLKPGTEANYRGYRSGENPTSTPIGMGYKPDAPSQTTANDFQSSNPQALEEAWYWSSTHYSADTAFIQAFAGGDQGTSSKDSRSRVRAVRRFKVID